MNFLSLFDCSQCGKELLYGETMFHIECGHTFCEGCQPVERVCRVCGSAFEGCSEVGDILKKYFIGCSLHRERQARFIDRKLSTYCNDCHRENEGLRILEFPGIIDVLNQEILSHIDHENVKGFKLKKLTRAYTSVILSKKVRVIRLINLYLSDKLSCLHHADMEAEYISSQFEPLCSMCSPKCIMFHVNEMYLVKSVKQELRKRLSLSNLSYIPKSILKQLVSNSGEINRTLAETLLFLEEKQTNAVNYKSRCLNCYNPFYYDTRYPIRLRCSSLHAICFECYLNLSQKCPFKCNEPNQIAYAPLKFGELPACVICTREFSICENRHPYRLRCHHDICSKCKEGHRTITCPVCVITAPMDSTKKDQMLSKAIEYAEFVSGNCQAKYFDLATRSLSVEQTTQCCLKVFEHIEFLDESLQRAYDYLLANKAIQKMLISPKLDLTLRDYFRFKLQTKLEFIQLLDLLLAGPQHQESDFKSIHRFSSLIPLTKNPVSRKSWDADSSTYNSLVLTVSSPVILTGLILAGSCAISAAIVKSICVLDHSETVLSRNDDWRLLKSQENAVHISPTIIAENFHYYIKVLYSENKLFCGKPSSRYSELKFQSIHFSVSCDRTARAILRNDIGGPILGFIFSEIY